MGAEERAMSSDQNAPPALTKEQAARQERFSSKEFADELTQAFRKGVAEAIQRKEAREAVESESDATDEACREPAVAAAAS